MYPALAFEIIVDYTRKKIKQFSFGRRSHAKATLLLLPLLLAGCLGTKYLEGEQKLLNRQHTKAPKGIVTEGMSDLYVQKPNRKLLGLTGHYLVWMYYPGLRRFNDPTSKDSKDAFIRKKDVLERKFDRKIDQASEPKKKSSLQFRKQKKLDALNKKIENGNLFMQWGEPAAVFDTTSMRLTTERITDYLFNKGYFLNHVSALPKIFRKTVTVVYTIDPGPRYRYDTLIYQIPDTTVLKYVKKSERESLVRRGAPYDQAKLGSERERIDLMLKDVGYYDFSRQYIDFDVDTSYKSPHLVAVLLKINNPARRDYHKQFVVDSVAIQPDAGVPVPPSVKRFTKVYRDITFSYYTDVYSERILSQRVFITKDSLYSRTKTFDTQRQLANLDVFKFVNVNYDTSGGRFIASIFTSPLDRYAWSNEAGVSLTQGFPGPYYSLSFKKRNIFRGLETFELTGRFGFEGVASATAIGNVYRSTEANTNASITFPQFLLPFAHNSSYQLGRLNPRTKLLAGYTYTDRPEYTRSIVTVSNTYNWENPRKTQYSFTLNNLNIIRSSKAAEFDELLNKLYLEQGNNLRNSFKPSFVSSMIFQAIWNPKNYGNSEANSFFVRAAAESGGTFFNFFTPEFITKEGLELYKYVRLSLDYRKIRVMNKHTVLAFRFNSGVGYSYGDNRTLPYEKFFFAGGSNSVRAWRPRRLGVGSYPPQLSANPDKDGLFDYRFEKPGQVLLEGSIELRKKLFGFVNGAVFVDAGNVWSLSETKPATESSTTAAWTGSTKFKAKEFYKQFGVGTGFGLRFDFTFLVLRLDAGIKAYDPGRNEGDRFMLNRFRFFKPFGTDREPVIYNVGIGYPF
ncbi:MAG TPA: BamA/TamA family outer membrane protein [Cyclobacteriaceae bacterium]|nr:BamA/TamA family outer membrane protein [Cyclobacteriaceae bacterium]